ncbi:MAG: hypothetical protein IJ857_05610 [Lachnospiraceae bacterium]|nr:hypothetical protein [Lachnospiraceae bacterium]
MEEKDMEKLLDDELDGVTGGVREDNKRLDTYGMSITCPNKGCPGKISETVYEDDTDPAFHSYLYHCDSCGTSFVIFRKRVILKDQWVKKCKKHNHFYPFASL